MKNKKRVLILVSLCTTLAASAGVFEIDPFDEEGSGTVSTGSENLCLSRDGFHCPSQSSKRSTPLQSPIPLELSSVVEALEESESFSSMSPVSQVEQKISLDRFQTVVDDFDRESFEIEGNFQQIPSIVVDPDNYFVKFQMLRRNQKILGVTMVTGVVASLPLAIQSVPQFRFQFEHLPSVADFRAIDSMALLHTAMPFLLIAGLMGYAHHLFVGNALSEAPLLNAIGLNVTGALSSLNKTNQQVKNLETFNKTIDEKVRSIDSTLNSIRELASKIKDGSEDVSRLASTIDLVLERQQALYDRQKDEFKVLQILITAIKKNNLSHVLEKLSREDQALVEQIETAQPLTFEQVSQEDSPKKSNGVFHWVSKRLGFVSKETEHSTTV